MVKKRAGKESSVGVLVPTGRAGMFYLRRGPGGRGGGGGKEQIMYLYTCRGVKVFQEEGAASIEASRGLRSCNETSRMGQWG